MTYHPAKVLKVISPGDKNVKSSDQSVQATLDMWDENIFTFIVDEKIAKDVKEEDVVLVDYRPLQGSKVPVPSQRVIKILNGKIGRDVWNKYKDFHKNRQKFPQTMPLPPQPSYMG